jgi:hypothetical protein
LPPSNLQQNPVVPSFHSSSTVLSKSDLPTNDIDSENIRNIAIRNMSQQLLETFFTDQDSSEQTIDNKELSFVNTIFHVPSIKEHVSEHSNFAQDISRVICPSEEIYRGLKDLKSGSELFSGTICRILSQHLEISNAENIDPMFKVKCLLDTVKISNDGKLMQMDFLWSSSRLCAVGAVKEIVIIGQLDCTIINKMNENAITKTCFEDVTIKFNFSSFIEQSANLKSISNISLKRNERLNMNNSKELAPL